MIRRHGCTGPGRPCARPRRHRADDDPPLRPAGGAWPSPGSGVRAQLRGERGRRLLDRRGDRHPLHGVLGAITIAVPLSRMTQQKEERHAALLAEASRGLTAQLAWSRRPGRWAPGLPQPRITLTAFT